MKASPANPLLAALAAGQPEAFAALYDRYGRSLLRAAGVMLGRGEDAQDAVQDLFVALVRSRHRFSYVEDLDAYIFAILRHAVGRRLTQRQSERRAMQRLALMPSQRGAPATVEETDLDGALASLPLEQREIVALKIDADLTFAQIAEILKTSPNTVASRYRYALEKLRNILKESP